MTRVNRWTGHCSFLLLKKNGCILYLHLDQGQYHFTNMFFWFFWRVENNGVILEGFFCLRMDGWPIQKHLQLNDAFEAFRLKFMGPIDTMFTYISFHAEFYSNNKTFKLSNTFCDFVFFNAQKCHVVFWKSSDSHVPPSRMFFLSFKQLAGGDG